jgi:hypothetical protein
MSTRTGILRSSSPLRPAPCFERPEKPVTKEFKFSLTPTLPYRKKSTFPTSRSHHKLDLTKLNIPAVLAHLSEEYSEEQILRVPPVFVPSCCGGFTTLGEPYEVTLRRAVERDGESVLVKKQKPTEPVSSEPETKRCSPKVTFAQD